MRIMEESSRAAGMLEGGEEPQPNSDIHSCRPVGRTSSRSSLRMLPRYCAHVPTGQRHTLLVNDQSRQKPALSFVNYACDENLRKHVLQNYTEQARMTMPVWQYVLSFSL